MVLCISSQSHRKPLFGQTACAFQATVKAKQGRCRTRKWWWKKRERHRDKSWTHPWGPPGRCWNPDRVSSRVHDSQSARLRALEAEACARCTTPGHFSLFCSLWFWNKPSFRGTPWAPSGKVNSPGGTDTEHYNQPQRDNTDILMDKLFQWYNRLTISLNTSIFEFSFKLHAIVSTKDSCALKLSMCKFSFVPDVVKRERGVICNFRLRTKRTYFSSHSCSHTSIHL